MLLRVFGFVKNSCHEIGFTINQYCIKFLIPLLPKTTFGTAHSVQYSLQDMNEKRNLDWIWKVCLTGQHLERFALISWRFRKDVSRSRTCGTWRHPMSHVSLCLIHVCWKFSFLCYVNVAVFFSQKWCLSCECMRHGFCFCFYFVGSAVMICY